MTDDKGAAVVTRDDPAAQDQPAPWLPCRRNRLVGLFAAVAAGTVLLDVVSKGLVVAGLVPGKPVQIVDGILYFTLARNSGAAWSLASDYTWALSLLAAVVVTAIVWYAFRKLDSLWWAIGLGLIAGGAVGNLVDRVFRSPGPLHGHVVDFISVFDPVGAVWPIFNLADSSLVVGVCVVVFLELTGRRIDGARALGKDGADES